MAKPEWGLKRSCRECGKRFYDFHRDPIVCPGCQAVFDPLAMLRPRRSRPTVTRAAKAPETAAEKPDETGEKGTGKDENAEADIIEVEDADIDDEAVIDTDDDDGMIKEGSDLGDDGIPDVIAGEKE